MVEPSFGNILDRGGSGLMRLHPSICMKQQRRIRNDSLRVVSQLLSWPLTYRIQGRTSSSKCMLDSMQKFFNGFWRAISLACGNLLSPSPSWNFRARVAEHF